MSLSATSKPIWGVGVGGLGGVVGVDHDIGIIRWRATGGEALRSFHTPVFDLPFAMGHGVGQYADQSARLALGNVCCWN